MNKGTRTALLIALILIVVGLIIFGILYAQGGKDMFNKLNSSTYHREYRPEGSFNKVFIDCESCSLTVVRAEGSECTVETEETEKLYFTVDVSDGTLRIVQHDDSRWLDRLFSLAGLGVKATVMLPAKQYDSLEIKNTSGGVSASDIECGSLTVDSTSGSVRLDGVECDAIDLESTSGTVSLGHVVSGSVSVRATSGAVTLSDMTADTIAVKSTSGRVRLERVIAEARLDADVTSGGITLDSVDGAELYLKSVSGSVRGSLLSGKRFDCRATSGSVRVPASTEGGVCVAETTSGSIDITVKD